VSLPADTLDQSDDLARRAQELKLTFDMLDVPTEVLYEVGRILRSLQQGEVPAAARKHVPRYPLVSATLVGRLAVSEARQGERLGAMLLADAVRRAYASATTVGSSMLVEDAISERAAAFYEGNGFVRLPDSLRLVLPMHAIQRLVEP
jgi:GNAT superfamily N-acetyltransferase